MASIPLEEAQANLDELITRVAQGEEFIITKDQKPVAKLVGQKKRRIPPFPDEKNLTEEQIDRDFALLDQLCADSDPANEKCIAEALQLARAQSKEMVRRQMGLGQ